MGKVVPSLASVSKVIQQSVVLTFSEVLCNLQTWRLSGYKPNLCSPSDGSTGRPAIKQALSIFSN